MSFFFFQIKEYICTQFSSTLSLQTFWGTDVPCNLWVHCSKQPPDKFSEIISDLNSDPGWSPAAMVFSFYLTIDPRPSWISFLADDGPRPGYKDKPVSAQINRPPPFYQVLCSSLAEVGAAECRQKRLCLLLVVLVRQALFQLRTPQGFNWSKVWTTTSQED